MNLTHHNRHAVYFALFALLLLFLVGAQNCFALATPGAGTFAYDLFDIGVNQILKGPIGFVAGVACMVLAAVLAVRQMLLPAVCSVLGGAFLLKADSVVQTIGAMVC